MTKNLHFTTLTINVTDLSNDKFFISISEDGVKKLFKNLELKGAKLYFELSKCPSQKNNKVLSIKRTFLNNWKKGKRIPIDVIEFICKNFNINTFDIQKEIIEIYTKSSKNSWKTNFPIVLNKDFFIISEAIRTEGCIIKGKVKDKIQGLAISNKDIFLIKLIESKIKNLEIRDKCFSRLLNIYAYPNKEQKVIRVLENSTNKEIHFKQTKDRLVFLEQIKDYNINKSYTIHFKEGKTKLKVRINENNIVTTDSDLHSTAYITLQIYNQVFARFLSEIFSTPFGIGTKKTFTIDFPFDINRLSKDILKEIINIVISCEGCVVNYKGTRSIRIKIGSINYLKKFQQILSIFKIESRIYNKNKEGLYILEIFRKNNLIKINNLIDFYVKYKKIQLVEALNSYNLNRVPHYEASRFYLSLIRKYEPTTIKELSKKTNTKYETLMGQLIRLDKKGLVEKEGKVFNGKGATPWVYRLSKKGVKCLENQEYIPLHR